MSLLMADVTGRNFRSGMKTQNTAEGGETRLGKRCPWEGCGQRVMLRSRVTGTLAVDKADLKMGFYCVAVVSLLALHSRA